MRTVKVSRERDDQLTPLPFSISFDLGDIEEGLSEEQFIEEARKVIRRILVKSKGRLDMDPGPFLIYDARVWKLIREVMAEY